MSISTTVTTMNASDVSAAVDLLYQQKISLTINQVMWDTWPKETVQKTRVRSAVEGSMKNPLTKCFKVVENGTKDILGVLVLSRIQPSGSNDMKERRKPDEDHAPPKAPAGLNPDVLDVVVTALDSLSKEVTEVDHIEITALVIVPSSRRNSLGSQLMQFAFESAKTDKVPLAVCSEPLSNNFFAKLGFQEIKHHDIDLSAFATPLSGFGVFRLAKMIWSVEEESG